MLPNKISDANNYILGQLLKEYKTLPFYKKLFYPSAISRALSEYETDTPSKDIAFAVCTAFLNSTWFFQRWFFRTLIKFSTTGLIRALTSINHLGLLTGDTAKDNFNNLAKQPEPSRVADAIDKLKFAGLLTGKNFSALVTRNDDNSCILKTIAMLNDAALLTEDYFNDLARCENQKSLANVMDILKKVALLTKENFNALVRHRHLESIENIMIILNKSVLFAADNVQANFNVVVHHSNSELVSRAITTLNAKGLLSVDTAQVHFNAVMQHNHPEKVAAAFVTLSDANMLSGVEAPANRNAVSLHQDPEKVACALLTLKKTHLLEGTKAEVNRQAIQKHKNPEKVNKALDILMQNGVLTYDTAQSYFKVLVECPEPLNVAEVLINLNSAQLLVANQRDRLCSSLVNQIHFEEMFRIGKYNREDEVRNHALIIYVERNILGLHSEPMQECPSYSNSRFYPDMNPSNTSLPELGLGIMYNP